MGVLDTSRSAVLNTKRLYLRERRGRPGADRSAADAADHGDRWRRGAEECVWGRRIESATVTGMRNELWIACALAVSGCGPSITKVVAPSGEPAYYIECDSGPGPCLEAASEACPTGYRVLERGERTELTVRDKAIIYGAKATGNELPQLPSTVRELMITCASDGGGSVLGSSGEPTTNTSSTAPNTSRKPNKRTVGATSKTGRDAGFNNASSQCDACVQRAVSENMCSEERDECEGTHGCIELLACYDNLPRRTRASWPGQEGNQQCLLEHAGKSIELRKAVLGVARKYVECMCCAAPCDRGCKDECTSYRSLISELGLGPACR